MEQFGVWIDEWDRDNNPRLFIFLEEREAETFLRAQRGHVLGFARRWVSGHNRLHGQQPWRNWEPVGDDNETVELWRHLLNDHGVGPRYLHGNPYNIHAAIVAGGACKSAEFEWRDPELLNESTRPEQERRAAEIRAFLGEDRASQSFRTRKDCD